jgi:hypothetical protein
LTSKPRGTYDTLEYSVFTYELYFSLENPATPVLALRRIKEEENMPKVGEDKKDRNITIYGEKERDEPRFCVQFPRIPPPPLPQAEADNGTTPL